MKFLFYLKMTKNIKYTEQMRSFSLSQVEKSEQILTEEHISSEEIR
jgi:hypothetical protein